MDTRHSFSLLAMTALVAVMASVTFGANLSPITPTVDHSKKATCGIKWSYNKNQAIKYFEIYRGTTEKFKEADLIAEVGNTTTRLTDWGAEQYQSYYYWVIPYDYNNESNVRNLDLTRYYCENKRYWGSSDVYLTTSVKSIAIGSTLPLYFKVNMGTASDPVYDHVKPDRVVFTKMTDLNGKDTKGIAEVCGNSNSAYSNDSTYLKSNGSFGYLVPYKPGVLYMRAYYKSATTVNPLRVEIKRPTFNLYAPEGEIDVVDNMYRDLYLKCNGKFVRPDVECMIEDPDLGPSVMIHPVEEIASTDDSDVKDGLYDNSFGFMEIYRSDDMCRWDITFNGILVKEYEVTPVWDVSRRFAIFYLNTEGNTVSDFYPNKTYYFGIRYGNTIVPHTVHKYGYYWSTYDWGDWGFVADNCYGPLSALGSLQTSSYGELGYFTTSSSTGWVQLSLYLVDRQLTDNSVRVKN